MDRDKMKISPNFTTFLHTAFFLGYTQIFTAFLKSLIFDIKRRWYYMLQHFKNFCHLLYYWDSASSMALRDKKTSAKSNKLNHEKWSRNFTLSTTSKTSKLFPKSNSVKNLWMNLIPEKMLSLSIKIHKNT